MDFITSDYWLAAFFSCALLLPPLPLPLGDSGVHIAPVAALAGFMIGMKAGVKRWKRPSGLVSFALLLFLAVIAESVTFAAIYSGRVLAAGSLARVFLFAIGVYVFFYTLFGPFRSDPIMFTRLLLGLAAASALFACIDCRFQLLTPAGHSAQYVILARGLFRRAAGVFFESSTLGNLCAFFLVMIFAASDPKTERICSWMFLALAGVIFTAALILSSSRASIVTVIVALCAMLTIRKGGAGNLVAGSLILFGTAGLIVYMVLPEFFLNYRFRVLTSLKYFWSSPNGVLSGRLSTWKTLLDFLLSHPSRAIFGIGYKTLPYTRYPGKPLIADNTYLSLLVETGVAGLAAFLLLNAAILRTGWRARRSFFGGWIFCFWCGEMVQMLAGDLITYWRVLPVYFWVLAIAAREAQA